MNKRSGFKIVELNGENESAATTSPVSIVARQRVKHYRLWQQLLLKIARHHVPRPRHQPHHQHPHHPHRPRRRQQRPL